MNIFIIGYETKKMAEFVMLLGKRLKYKTIKLNNFTKRRNGGYIFTNSHDIKQFIKIFRPNEDATIFLETYGEHPKDFKEYSALMLAREYVKHMVITGELEGKKALDFKLEESVSSLEECIDCVMRTLKKSVCALIQNSKTGLYLGVSRKHDPNDFGLPGGKVDPGETLPQAIVRETKEETGLDITNLNPVFTDFAKNNKIYHCTTFTADYSGIIHTEEKGVVKWVTKEELLNGSFGDYNRRLFKALEKAD